MDKTVIAIQTHDQLQTDRLPQIRMKLFLRGPVNDRKHLYFGGVAEAGHLMQCLLRFDGEAGQFSDHQVDHIVGVTLGVNATEIPGPSPRDMIEGEYALISERG